MKKSIVKGPDGKYPRALVKDILMGVVREGILSSAMSADPFTEKVSWALKPNFETACWSFQSPTHKIYLGEGCLDRARPGLTQEQLHDYGMAYLRHERDGHGRYTLRKMSEITELLRPLPGVRDNPIPFSLFNLFSDARIEHLDRIRTGDNFRWREFELEATNVQKSPGGVLFLIIQAETEAEALTDTWLELEAQDKPDRLARVLDYYLRIIACKSEWDLRPLMLEWLDEFQDEEPPENQAMSGLGASELEQGFTLSGNATTAALFDFDVSSLTEPPKVPSKSLERGEENSKSSVDGGTGELLLTEEAELDERRIKQLTRLLRRTLVGPSRARDTDNATTAIALHNLLPGGDPTLPFVESSRRGRAKRKLGFIMDCSGSMGSEATDPMGYGREVVAAMSDLAREGLVSGYVLLSAVVGGKAQWQRFKLPMSRQEISRMHGFAGAEGLAHAMESNASVLRHMHRNFLYSDGSITDRQPDKGMLRAKGLEVIGLYCGETDSAAGLAKHVKRSIIRATPEDLALAMLKELKGM